MKRIGNTALVLIVLLLAALVAGSAHAESALITDVASEAELRSALENNAPWIRLTEDILLGEMLEFKQGAVIDMTLDLNGHALSRQSEEQGVDGHVISVWSGATINIVNSDTEHRGVITGGNAIEGAGIFNNGVVTLKGITLTGNTACNPDSQDSLGSAIMNQGTMYLEDVVVTGNTAVSSGKGSAIYNAGDMYVSDITVTGNEGGTVGGIYSTENLYVSGSLVFTENSGAGLELYESTTLNVIGAISSGSRIDIRHDDGVAITSGFATYNPDLSPGEVFFPLDENQRVFLQNSEVIFRTGVAYVERSWNGERVVAETKICYDYTLITSDLTQTTLNEGWYIMEGSVNKTDRMEVSGDVHLILLDGANAILYKGIHVGAGSSLTIYGQFYDPGTGIAMGSGAILSFNPGDNMAGIGGNNGEAAGSITIHGGGLLAGGGINAPGLGGGPNAPSGTEQRITIYEGIVSAIGGANACGMGNGRNSDGARLTVYGGSITAAAGSDDIGAFGLDADPSTAINLMTIPGDFKVSYLGPSSGMIDAPGAEREFYAQTSRVADITACTHEQLGLHSISDTEHAITCPSCTLCESRSAHVLSETRIGTENHYAICEACGAAIGTAHDFGDNNLCACGASRIHVSFVPGDGTGEAYTVDVTTLVDFEMPETSFTAPTDKWFVGWREGGVGKLYLPGTTQVFTGVEDVTFTAAWSGETWAVLQNRINTAGDEALLELSGDVFATADDSPLLIPAGKNITLDLGPYTLNRNLSQSTDQGSVIMVDGTLTLKGMEGSMVTGGNTTDVGGGIYVNYGGSLTVEGCEIGGNHADYAGGAVAIMGGEASMTGGAKISDNTAGYAGGGVALIRGTLAMDGLVNVTGNTSDYIGGGVAVMNDSSFAVSGSIEIFGNQRRVTLSQGDVLSSDDIYLGRGTVLDVLGPLTKTHPYVVTTEVLSEYARPVYITNGLSGNGGVEDFQSMRPGEDVLFDEVNGEAVLAVEMVSVRYLPGNGTGEETVLSTPDGTEMVLPENNYGFTAPEGTTFSGWHRVGEAENIVYRPGDKIVLDGDTELVARYAYKWAYLQALFNEGATIVLQGDTIAGESDTFLLIPEGVTVDLDLNGFAIDRNMQHRDHMGCVICVNGELILRDSSQAQSGSIRGGWTYRAKQTSYRSGCAFDINGKLTMYGGNITDNRDENLSIVSVNNRAQFVLYGGSIHDNRGNTTVNVSSGGNFAQYGGEIRNNVSNVTTITVRGTTLLQGGSVSYNTSYGYGGAYTLFFSFETDLSIKGGEIVGNVGKTGGGIVQHVAVWKDCTFNLSGSPVIEDNTFGDGLDGDICIIKPHTQGDFTGIIVTGPIGEDVRIGVRFINDDINRAFTQGLAGRGKVENFFSNAGDAIAEDDTSGEAVMGTPATLFFEPGEGGSGKMLPLHKVVGMNVIMPENGFTPPEGFIFVAWEDEDGKLYFPGEQLIARTQMTLRAVWGRSKWQLLAQQLELARGKTIVMMEDLTADEALGDGMLVVPAGASAILDLNGHTLYRAPVGDAAEDGVISVAGTLTIRDSSEEKTGTILSGTAKRSAPAIQNTGTLTIEAGVFDGFKSSGSGAVIKNEGTLTIAGGTFTNNVADGDGGVIANSGNLVVKGGAFRNNEAAGNGGAIQNEGTLTISGGLIERCYAAQGGGVFNASAATAVISGGEISSCQGQQNGGGAVWNEGALTVSGGLIRYNLVSSGHGAGIWTNGTLDLTGGSITLNQCWNAYNHGGGVYVAGGTVNISGSPRVVDNLYPGHKSYDDIYLVGGAKLNLTGALAEDASMGVWTDLRPTLESPIVITSGLAEYGAIDNFFTNDETRQPLGINDEGEAVFGAPIVIYFRTASGDDSSGSMDDIHTTHGATLTIPEYGYPMPTDKKFVGWTINGTCYHPGETLHVSAQTMGSKTVVAVATWEATSWSALQTWLNDPHGGVYVMTEDATAVTGEGPLTIPAGASATIDLNGHTIDRNLETPEADGSAIVVNGELTIVDSSAEGSGLITGGKSTGNGGGILNNGMLTITGGTISGNSGQEAGAVSNSSGSQLTITGGTYENNTAVTYSGGAFVNNGTMTMSGGMVRSNTAAMNGGGIWTNGTLTLTGGTITGNDMMQSTGNGGGIYFRGGTLNIGGEPIVTDNMNNNLRLLSGLKLTVASKLGKKANIHVSMQDSPASGKRVLITQGLSGQGSVSSFTNDAADYPILANGNGDAVLSSYAVFSYDANGGTGTGPNRVTKDIPGTIDLPSSNPFTAPEGKIFVGWMINGRIYDNGERYVFDLTTIPSADVVIKAAWATSEWNALEQLFLYGGSRTITLTQDVIAPENEGTKDNRYLIVPADVEITLDLNGHTLSRGLNRSNMPYSAGYAIIVGGTLTIRDSSPTHSGIITGGACRNSGGGIAVGGTLNIYDVTITGNYAKGSGAGVYIGNEKGVINMYSGEIRGNTSDGTGGGVRLWGGTFNMYGGTISGNTARTQGGAMYILNSGTFNMYGGRISGNTAGTQGGAIYVDRDSKLNVSGNLMVRGNTLSGSNAESNIYMMADDARIGIVGALDPLADIGVSVSKTHIPTITDGMPGNGTRGNFHADMTGFNIWIGENGEAEIGMKSFLILDPGAGGSGSMPDIMVDDGATIIMPECGFIAPEGKQFLCWKMDDGTFMMAGEKYLPAANCTATAIWDVAPATLWIQLQQLIDASAERGIIKLKDDVTALAGEHALTVPNGVNVVIDLNGHTIDRARTQAEAAGGVFIVQGGTLTIRDTSEGESGRVTGGKTTGSGGGVRVSSGTLYMEGGTITGNEASNSWGGGVYLYSSNSCLYLRGGVISGNTADRNGGGVHVSEGALLNVSGHGVVRDNTKNDGAANNVNLASDSLVHVNGKLEDSADICVSSSITPTVGAPVAITDGFAGRGALSNFSSDRDGGLIKLMDNGEAGVHVQITVRFKPGEGVSGSMSDAAYAAGDDLVLPEPTFSAPAGKTFGGWQINGSLEIFDAGESFSVEDERFGLAVNTLTATWADSAWAAVNMKMAKAAEGPVTVRLTRNVKALGSDGPLSVPAATTVTLDLNGYTLDRGLTSVQLNGQVIIVNGTLNLVDTSASQAGRITGAYNDGFGGGILIAPGGCLNMYGGTISGNRADKTSFSDGTLYGGMGGGVYIYRGAQMHMYGGTITGNKSKEGSAGVHIDRESYHGLSVRHGVFTVGGSAKIYGNDPGDLNFVPIDDDSGGQYGIKPEKISINAPLSDDARIAMYIQSGYPEVADAAFVTDGLAGKGSLDNFSLSDEGYTLVQGTNGEIAIVRKQEFPMTGFEIPEMITGIEEEAFAGLTMDSVYISDNCQMIGAGAFGNCSRLKRVSLPRNCVIDDTAFDGTANEIWLYIPRGGTTQTWAERYALTHSCIVYLMDD